MGTPVRPPLEMRPERRHRGLSDHLHDQVFQALCGRALVFNTCWEDPAVDREALHIGPDDEVLVIASAGCNALDYALDAPRAIHAVDANPRQIALVELKLAGIRALDFETFFRVFGRGRHACFRGIYRERLRPDLSAFARAYWDRRTGWFEGRGWRNSFYWHGLSGLFARAFRSYVDAYPRLRRDLLAAFEATSLDEQRRIYDERLETTLFNESVVWALRRTVTMSLLGIPYAQRREVQRRGGWDLPHHIRDAVGYVVRNIPLAGDYFWTVYLRGGYTRDCCPAYLKPEGFARLKGGLVDRIHPCAATVTGFLRATRERITRFVLLDHMDWMSRYRPDDLVEEWEEILSKAAPGARIIFRSGAARPTFLDDLRVRRDGSPPRPLGDFLVFDRERADALYARDRVHTYGSFHIADIRTER